MSISTADKQYWIKELTATLNAKIISVSAATGNTNIVDDIKALTKRDLISKLDLGDVFEVIEGLREKSREAYKLHNELDSQVNDLQGQVRDVLKKYTSEYSDGSNGHRSHMSLDQMMDDIVDGQYLNIMKQEAEERNDDRLKEIATYVQAIKDLERTIMLTTSNTQMSVFLRKFGDKFGVSFDSLI